MRSNSPVRLVRTTEPLYNEGNPYVLLSPSGNPRNIRTLYDVIRNEKDSRGLCADYTIKGIPFIGLTEKKRKSPADAVAADHLCKQRRELTEILLRTTETVERKFKYLTDDQRQANRALKILAITAPLDRDIKVGDIKPHLKTLNQAYGIAMTKAWQEKEVEPYRDHTDQQKIKRQRARQFINMESSTRLMLVNALMRIEDKGPQQAIAGIKAMDDFLRNFLNPTESYREMVRKVTSNADLQFFCRRWLSAHPLSGKKGTIYQSDHKFEPYPWARLLDTLCRLIVRECHRQTVVVSDTESGQRKGSVVFRRASLANLRHMRSEPHEKKIVLEHFPFMHVDGSAQTKISEKTKKD